MAFLCLENNTSRCFIVTEAGCYFPGFTWYIDGNERQTSVACFLAWYGCIEHMGQAGARRKGGKKPSLKDRSRIQIWA